MRKTHLLNGLLIGLIVYETAIIWRMRKTCGTLKIDLKGEKERYMFEIDDLDALSTKKFVRLRVDNKADLSQN